MKIAFGCDPNAYDMKKDLIKVCEDLRHEVTDFGSEDTIYANTAFQVAEAVSSGQFDRGVLVCGTGIGMSIAANKVKGAYAALIADVYSAERAALSNNANIACFGAFTLGEKLAPELLKTWLSNEFDEESGSAPKVARYKKYDEERGECYAKNTE